MTYKLTPLSKNMRKFLVTLTFLAISMASVAQEEANPIDKFKVITNSFGSNWFMDIHLSLSNFIDGGAGDALLATPTWGGSLSLGKWFTPGLGLRAKFNGWDTKNNNFGTRDNRNKYWILTSDMMFNFTNLFKGYNESRVWNIVPYIAGGIGRNCTLNHYAPIVGGGILSSWKVCTKLDVVLECSYKIASNDFGGVSITSVPTVSSDRIFSIEAGVSYRLGKTTWNKAGDTDLINNMTQMEIDALNAQIADLEAENEMLRNQVESSKSQLPQ